MTEIAQSASQDQPSAQPSSDTLSGGAMLKKAREASGLHIAAMAVSLKVPVKKLEALESDRFDLLPDTVFVRALASSVCRNLKIDPNPILVRLPHIAAPRLKTDESGINAPFRETGDSLNLPFWEQLSKPMVLAVLLVVIGILVLLFVPFGAESGLKDSKSENDDVLSVPTSAAEAIEQPIVEQPTKVDPIASVAEAVLRVPQQVTVPVLADAHEPVAAAMTKTPPSTAGSVNGMVVMTARASTWVQVVDANGGVQVRKNMAEGEQIGASGAAPLSVVIGRADAVQVQVYGKPFDLTRVAKDNVARFEVK
ncbi:MAG: helix-turn-helix domain-containing protein [Rhodoferax sp.]|jgi:cytoskeleton protein RodZ|nr:helix-turn-helix domain-containing protein [Rhodoferax sp.]MBP9058757.1 helix-turn-helix domain-containing protein [Rhodoferax sp.]MBP9683401.1 helix-turn-helix domain-containing protein [Rhodoferax sp.]